MIGELINKFDNQGRTRVKQFNKIFPFAKLRGYHKQCEVEILEPVLGKERVRLISVDGKEFEHSFIAQEHRSLDFKKPAPRNFTPRKGRFIYKAIKGQEVKEFEKILDMAKFLNRSRTAIWERLNAGLSKNVDGWVISKQERR